jgi:PKHD-type hydroxylase
VVGAIIVKALESHPLFVSAALPKTILSPMFNRYGEGMGFGDHIDNSVRRDPVTGQRLRTDLSATLFLAEPETMTAASWWSTTCMAVTRSSWAPAT